MFEDANPNTGAADTAPASPSGDTTAKAGKLDREFAFIERRADVVSYMLGETIPGFAEDRLLWSAAADLVDRLAIFKETCWDSAYEEDLLEIDCGADVVRFVLKKIAQRGSLVLIDPDICEVLWTATGDLLGRLMKFRNGVDQELHGQKTDCWQNLPSHCRLFPASRSPAIPLAEARTAAAEALHQADLLFHDLERVRMQFPRGADSGRDREGDVERMRHRADVVRFMFYADDGDANTAARIPDTEILRTATEDLLTHIARFRERLDGPDNIDGDRRGNGVRWRRWRLDPRAQEHPTTVDERDVCKLARMREEAVTKIDLSHAQREHLADIEDALAATAARTLTEIRAKARVAAQMIVEDHPRLLYEDTVGPPLDYWPMLRSIVRDLCRVRG